MGFLWNHWFWITLGVLMCVGGEASENSQKLVKNAEGPVSLPIGARGGKALLLPPPDHHFNSDVVNRFDLELGPTRRPTVSVSKSVSKVSVKMGKVSVGTKSGGAGALESLAKISDIYVDRGIPPTGDGARRRRPVFNAAGPVVHPPHSPRRIQPYYIGYNLVYREPEKKKLLVGVSSPLHHSSHTVTGPSRGGSSSRLMVQPPNSTPNVGLLATIIAKLKSLAEATSSRIRFSNLLTEQPVLLTTPSTTVVPSTVPTTTSTVAVVQEQEEPHEVVAGEKQHVLVRVDDLGVTTDEETPRSDERVDQPRSLEARGRSLPLPFLDKLESQSNSVSDMSSQDWEEGEEGDVLNEIEQQHILQENLVKEVIKEIEEEEILEDVLEVENNDLEADQVNSEELIQQGDFIQDFTAPESIFSGSEDVKISAERIDQSNVSAVMGVILGIIIFVIISIVLVLLFVQRRHSKTVKSTEPAEDVISQASYMTYSTTVSDHSVNYGPANWEKDMCEDLCSLDNDSFLNSLEAVTTTDYWGTDHY